MGPRIIGSKKVWPKKNMVHKKSPPKMGSVTAEILQIWTDVARANVAWTNVTVTVKFWSKWGQ